MIDHGLLSDTLKVFLSLLTGGGAVKVVQAIRQAIREKINAPGEQDRVAIALTTELQNLARAAVAEVRIEIDEERAKTRRLTARVALLERVLHEHHIDIPPDVVPQA